MTTQLYALRHDLATDVLRVAEMTPGEAYMLNLRLHRNREPVRWKPAPKPERTAQPSAAVDNGSEFDEWIMEV